MILHRQLKGIFIIFFGDPYHKGLSCCYINELCSLVFHESETDYFV